MNNNEEVTALVMALRSPQVGSVGLKAAGMIEMMAAQLKEHAELLDAVYVSDDDNRLYIQYMDFDEWDQRKATQLQSIFRY